MVETKYAEVPKWIFPKVLKRITQNAKMVEAWLPPCEAKVICCLVLASLDDVGMTGKLKSYENGQVRLFNANSLWAEIVEASERVAKEPDLEVADRIWKLSGIKIKEN